MTSNLQDYRLSEIESDGHRHGFNLDRTNLLSFFFVLTVSVGITVFFRANFLNFIGGIMLSSTPIITKVVKKLREKDENCS